MDRKTLDEMKRLGKVSSNPEDLLGEAFNAVTDPFEDTILPKDDLLSTTAIGTKKNSTYFDFDGGMDENLNDSAPAIAARRRKKEKEDQDRRFQDQLAKQFQDDLNADDDDLFPWRRRMRRARGDDPDARKKRAHLEDEDINKNKKRVAVDEDGKRVIVDKDGRIATDAEGKHIVIGEKDGYKIKDAGNGHKVVVGPDGKVLNGADGKPIYVHEGDDFRITTEADGQRVAVGGKDGATKITMSVDTPLSVKPGPDLETIKAATPVPATPAGTPEKLSGEFKTSTGADTAKFNTFLTQQGETLEKFQARVKASGKIPEVPRGASLDIPTRHLDAPHVRGSRFLRMVTPNGFDLLIAGGVGTGVAVYEGWEAGALDLVGGKSVASAAFTAANAGKAQGLKAGAETLPIVGTSIAFAEGRSAEGTVRAIEDVVEFASPFVFATIGGAGGAAVGAPAGGIGAVPGAIIGFVGGLAVGAVVSLTASEATRTIARGLGYDDVDRGMISSWFMPSYAEEMEGWIKSVAKDGSGWKDGESLSQVMERINKNAGSAHERTQNFRQLLDHINKGIYEKQNEQVKAVADRIARDTGVQDVTATLRLPEARAKIMAFYKEQATQNPQDEEIKKIVDTLTDYEKTETERLKVVAARVGADMMDAKEINSALRDNLSGGLDRRMVVYSDDPAITGEMGAVQPDDGVRAVMADLDSINYNVRMAEIRAKLDAGDSMNARDVITKTFANGTDAYGEMGTTAALAESYNLMLDTEEKLAQSQQKLVTDNWQHLQGYMSADSVIKGGWFGSDTTLGAALEKRLKDAKVDDPEAQELRALLSDSNNLKNLTPEMAAKLMSNGIFLNTFKKIDAYQADTELRRAFDKGGLEFRTGTLQDVRRQRRELETAVKPYGFDIGATLQAGQHLTPQQARQLLTERPPEAPKPTNG